MRNRLTIRINDSLRQALAERATSQGKSVSTLVREILEKAVTAQPLKDRIGHLRGSLALDKAATGAYSGEPEHRFRRNVNTSFANALRS